MSNLRPCVSCYQYRILNDESLCERCVEHGLRFRSDYQELIERLSIGVRRAYSETKLRLRIQLLTDSGLSLREIARLEFHGKVTHGTVQRALKGKFPKGKKLRDAMGLPPLVDVEACPDCGRGHSVGWCVDKFGEPKKPRKNSKPTKTRPPSTIYVGKMTPEEKDKIMQKQPEDRKQALLNEEDLALEDPEPFPDVPEERLERACGGRS